MRNFLMILIVALTLCPGAFARPRNPNTNPGVDAVHPAATYVKWEALTSVQQQSLAKAWGMSPAKAAVKWNALKAVDQNNTLAKYCVVKAVSPRR